jgi:tetratricopeptide (TPR) repeat protein
LSLNVIAGRVFRETALTGAIILWSVGGVFSGGLDQAKTGLTALAAGAYQEAITHLTEAIDSNELPEEQAHLFYTARGYAKAAEGDFQAAIDDYTQSLAKHPGYAAAVFNRGNAYFHQHQYDQAIVDYSKALEVDVTDAKALNNRGAAWFKKGNLQSAMANFTMALAIDPEDPDLFLNRGKVYEALGDADKAREDFLQVKKLDPSAKTPLD